MSNNLRKICYTFFGIFDFFIIFSLWKNKKQRSITEILHFLLLFFIPNVLSSRRHNSKRYVLIQIFHSITVCVIYLKKHCFPVSTNMLYHVSVLSTRQKSIKMNENSCFLFEALFLSFFLFIFTSEKVAIHSKMNLTQRRKLLKRKKADIPYIVAY